jgi:glycyl-tRNA synthetase beta chain
MSKDLLLEIGTEEIPARFIPRALADLRAAVAGRLDEAGLAPAAIRVLGTPRRLALLAEHVPEEQPERVELVLGPARKVAFDDEGKPTRAAAGFARGQGVEVGELVLEATPKGEYVAVRKRAGGIKTVDLLADVLPEVIRGIPFPKSMRWGDGEVRFVRPIHWIVATLGREAIHFKVGDVRSGRESRGHRFTHPGAVKIGSPGEYVEALEAHGVIVDPADRRARIESEVHAWAATVDGRPIPDPELLEHVTFLVELPTSVRGAFDPDYLGLPRDVLITAMREHQKVFSVEGPDGNLLPYFVSILNISPRHHEVVVRGNERVLRARLADARFFFEEDRKRTLADRVPDLAKVLWQAKLGSIHDKVGRLERLARTLGEELGLPQDRVGAAARAAHLCKADLVTHLVGEFPNLQGIMGREYARLDGEPEDVARAIEEHYRPRHAGGPLPETDAGALLAIADKLDTLAGCFHAGLLPTATQDPYGLRRAALGVIGILEKFQWRLRFDEVVKDALALFGEPEQSGWLNVLLEFFKGRLQHLLLSLDHPPDVVDAVISARLERKRDWDIVGVMDRVRVLAEAKKQNDFIPLATTFRRVSNIIPKGGMEPWEGFPELEGLNEHAERELLQACGDVFRSSQPLIENRRYRDLFDELRRMKDPVDRFFEEVRVLDPDNPELRKKRLGLLHRVADLFYELADFSKIRVEQETRT